MKSANLNLFLIIGAGFFILAFTAHFFPVSFPEQVRSVLAKAPTWPTSSKENTLEETDNPKTSSSQDWWLDSGGLAYFSDDKISTIQGDLSRDNHWRQEYAGTNPIDTDSGLHPQNLFRLISKKFWGDLSEQAYFNLKKYHVSASDNRNESNGLLLFARYADADNLYYAGLRVDGLAVIKKKYQGGYSVLGEQAVFPGTYDRDKNSNLLPMDRPLGIKLEVSDTKDGGVNLDLYLDTNNTGDWQKILSAKDEANNHPLSGASAVGIRTDFADVVIKDYEINRI